MKAKKAVLSTLALAAVCAPLFGASRIQNGVAWRATDGSSVNAHGGGMYYENGYYYWFGENRNGMRSNGVSVYRSTDLLNWENLGLALTPGGERKNTLQDIAEGRTIERPKVIHNASTGKYVMWAHWEDGEDYSKARVMVATADKPEGPYTLVRTLRPNGQESRDQTVFADDDGRAYHLRASEDNMTLQCTLLADDWTKPTDTWVRAIPGKQYEAPAIMKINGTYIGFFSGCTGWRPNPGHVCTTRDLLSENWNDLGNPCVDDNAETTYTSQPTYALKVQGYDYAYMYMGDRWNSSNVQTSTYVWLPVMLRTGVPFLRWFESWDPAMFETLDAIRRAARIDDNGSYVLLSRLADRVVSLNGSSVCLIDDNDAKMLHFVFEPTGEENTYRLHREDSSDYLTASGSSVKMAAATADASQEWIFERQSDNFYLVVSRSTGKCLSVRDASIANNAALELTAKGAAAKSKFGVYFDKRRNDYEEDSPFAPAAQVGIEDVAADTTTPTLSIADGTVTVNASADVELSLYDINGRLVDAATLPAGAATYTLPDLTSGIYLLRAVSEGATTTLKLAL